MTSVQGTDVGIPTEDGIADAYLAHPADGAPRPAVLLFQDAFGLRPQLRSMADRLAEAGYTVLVPNVFYRHGRTPVFELPEFIDPAARPEIFEKIVPVMQALTPELAMRDAGAYLRWLAERPEVAEGPVALTGYCMGARLSLLTAGTYPDRVAAAAGFHGGRLATDTPDSPHLVAGNITAELYFGHADNDVGDATAGGVGPGIGDRSDDGQPPRLPLARVHLPEPTAQGEGDDPGRRVGAVRLDASHPSSPLELPGSEEPYGVGQQPLPPGVDVQRPQTGHRVVTGAAPQEQHGLPTAGDDEPPGDTAGEAQGADELFGEGGEGHDGVLPPARLIKLKFE